MKNKRKGKNHDTIPLRRRQKSSVERPNTKPIWRRTSTKVWGIFLVVAAIVGFLSDSLNACRLSFPTTDLSEKSQPLDGPFVLKNDGWWPVTDVNVVLRTEGLVLGQIEVTGGFSCELLHGKSLAAGEQVTVSLADRHIKLTPMPANVAMHFNVTFRPSWMWWHVTKVFQYHTRTASDGTVRWYPGKSA